MGDGKKEIVLSFSDFKHEGNSDLFVPKEGTGCSPGKFIYSDGFSEEKYILGTIKKTDDIKNNSGDLMKAARSWASLYHLGAGRSNIIKALDLPPDLNVLEPGSGCGALTRYLGETFRAVDGVEGSYLRAKIARARCRDMKNVRIFCSDIKVIKPEPIYDVVVLAGVLEYAPVYFGGNAYESCSLILEMAGAGLKPGGILILAIENKIGLKYWSGCKEDHTGRIYEGIHGYPSEKVPVTFSKKEINMILSGKGFDNVNYHYCFPDYKFATTIFSGAGDEGDFYLHNWVTVPFSSYGSKRAYTFHEGLAAKTLSQAGLLREFANSFLIVASRGVSKYNISPDWIAKRFPPCDLRDQYKCVTTLKTEPGLHVSKSRMIENSDGDNKSILKLSHKVYDASWYKGDLLIFDLFKISTGRNFKNDLKTLMREYYRELIGCYSAGRADQEGFPLLRGDSIDFIFRNIIRQNKKLIPIDMEWSMARELTADYVLYRCSLDIISAQYPRVNNNIMVGGIFSYMVIKSIFPRYGIRRHQKNRRMEKVFQNSVKINFNLKKIHNPSLKVRFKGKIAQVMGRFIRGGFGQGRAKGRTKQNRAR